VDSRERYDVLISCHLLDKSEARRFAHAGTRYIRILYSTIGKNYTYSAGNGLYDLILTIGAYSEERLRAYAPCVSVGMPRYDRLLSGGYGKESIRREFGLDGARPVLVYLPTWSDQCTIEKFGAALARLTAQYDIVVKPHPLTLIREKEKLDVLEKTPVKLIREDCPIDKLMAMADLVITDYSSTIFEAAAADKPLLLLNLDKATLEKSALYCAHDPEHQYRHIAVSVDDPEALPQMIESARADCAPWPARRRECSDRFFACRDGTSSEKAAQTIEKFVAHHRCRAILGRWRSRIRCGLERLREYYDRCRPRIGLGRKLRRLMRGGARR